MPASGAFRATLALLALMALAGCATFPRDFPRLSSHAFNDPSASALLSRTTHAAEAHQGESGFHLLESDTDAFAARAMMTMRAERALDVQYYLVHDGLTTRVLMHLVLEAADRGVRVRILLDDTTTRGKDFAVATLAAHPNIEVRLFNPYYSGRSGFLDSSLALLTHLDRLHRRMHNKLWIVDNAIAVSGGRNLGDEYFGAAGDVNFADIDLMSIGPVVTDLSRSFDDYWNSQDAVPIEAFVARRPTAGDLKRLRSRIGTYAASTTVQRSSYLARLRDSQDDDFLSLADQDLSWGKAEAVWDDPSKVDAIGVPGNAAIADALRPYFEATTSNVLICSAYFVPGDDGVRQLSALRARGVRVQVLTNSLQATDVPFVYGAYADYRKPLLAAGVELHEWKPMLRSRRFANHFGLWGSLGASLHTKAIVFDDRTAFVGSYNFDPRSRFWNTEVGVIVHSPELAARLRAVLTEAIDERSSYRLELHDDGIRYHTREQGRERVTVRAPASLWRRFQSWVSDKFGPERMM